MVLDVYLQKFFVAYTPLIVRRWQLFMIIPMLSTGFLSLGLFRINELKNLDSEYVHSPDDAPSKSEKALINDLWPLKTDEFLPQRSFNYRRYLMVLITGAGCSNNSKYRSECNLLNNSTQKDSNQTYLDLIENLESYLATNISITSHNNSVFTYNNLCLSWWENCVRTNTLIKMLIKREELRENNIAITYPRANTHATPIYLAFNLGGVITDTNTSEITSITSFRLTFFLRSDTHDRDILSKQWQDTAVNYLNEFWSKDNKYLSVTNYHSDSITQGLARQNAKVFPKFALAIVVLLIFATICCIRWRRGGICLSVDMISSKTTLAGIGVLTATMGIASGFGLLMIIGIYRSGVTVVVPFLIISIGVDDMFILVGAWHHSHGKGMNLAERMSITLKEAAVAITITSLTDALSFAVGAFSKIPSVRWFCIYASTCITFNYVYQITFFVSFMVIYGKWELSKKNCLVPCFKSRSEQVSHDKTVQKNGYIKHHRHLHSLQIPPLHDLNGAAFFEKYYGPALLHPISKALVIISLIAYLSISVFGCLRLKQGMNIDDLLLKSDPTIRYLNMASQYFTDGWQCEVVITNPPNMTLKINRDKIMLLVEEFENSTYSIGKDGTQFWLRNYINYLEATNTYIVDDSSDLWLIDVFKFVHMFSFQKAWKQDLAWQDGNTLVLKAFRFRIGLSFEWEHPYTQRKVVDDLRRIANKYPEWGVSTYGGYIWTHVDQYETVLPTTLQNVIIALVCMLIVSLLLIPSAVCTIWITLTIISIDIGVVGFMTLWGVSLSQISMITIIMSIGFSVDFAAHITYGYVSCDETDDKTKVINALKKLGWPLFQAGLSTILGVSVLGTVDSAMILIFLKTIALVILFGMLHALVFLPVLLIIVMPYCTCLNHFLMSRFKCYQLSQQKSAISLLTAWTR